MLSLFFYIYLSFSSVRNRNKHVFTCNHDRELKAQLRNAPPHKIKKSIKADQEDVPSYILSQEVNNRLPIRVRMDLRAINDPKIDSKACQKVNDVVDVDGSKITCRSEDILDNNKKQVIIQTIKNAEDYIHRLVNITRVNGSLNDIPITTSVENIKNDVGWKDQTLDVKDCDLFIFVLPRPYGPTSDTLASATARSYIKSESPNYLDYYRPCVGLININVAKLPSKAQNYDDGDRQFFVTVMHELMHVLAFSNGLFNYWVNRTSGHRYNSNISNFKFTNNYNIEQSFISTPRLTQWVHDRFQVINPELLRFGLELEDGGGRGTAGSHPNSRLYFTDIMQGKTYGPGYFSPIYFHSLYDAGWYEPNYDMQEQLIYLDPRFVNEPISQYVLTEPPRDSFPKELFCSNNMQSYCYYDYSYKAVCDTLSYKEIIAINESALDQVKFQGNFQTWYGGPGNHYSDEENFDYMPVLFPSGDSNCRNENAPNEDEDVANRAKRMEETYSTSSVCVLTTIWKQSLTQFSLQKNAGCYKARCGEDNKLRISLPKTPEQVCTRENQRIYKKGSTKYALCPNVAAACANFPNKSSMVTVESALPDRGPYDGKNYVILQGFNLKKYSVTKVIFGIIKDKAARKVGPSDYTSILEIPSSQFIDYTDTKILIKMPSDLKVGKDKIGVSIDLIFDTVGNVDVNFVENIYTFLKRDYKNP